MDEEVEAGVIKLMGIHMGKTKRKHRQTLWVMGIKFPLQVVVEYRKNIHFSVLFQWVISPGYRRVLP